MTFVRNASRAALAALALGALLAPSPTRASSHREAPLITEDPVADNTDVYAFVDPNEASKVVLISNWIPLEEPAGGPNFNRFGDDARYDINVDNDGDARDDIAYEFRFKTTTGNPDTFLYNTGPITSLNDPDWNVRQTYTVTRVQNGKRTVLGTNLATPPVNIGPRSTPNYEALAAAAVHTLPGGIRVFAGQRDEAFPVDLGSVFDLAGLRPFNPFHLIPLPAEAGIDDTSGFNVHTIALQVPASQLVDGDPVIGVYSTTYRRKMRNFLGNDGADLAHQGPWVQVSRLGMPLVNELVIPLGSKDRFNASEPNDDGQFAAFVLDPEPARLIPILYPGVFAACFPTPPRADIATIFLTGVPGLNQPANVTGSEMIRLNTAIPPTPIGSRDRLGLLAGQLDGFPNGRRLEDDVVDIELRALAGATPLGACNGVFPNNALGDGADGNDLPFLPHLPVHADAAPGLLARARSRVLRSQVATAVSALGSSGRRVHAERGAHSALSAARHAATAVRVCMCVATACWTLGTPAAGRAAPFLPHDEAEVLERVPRRGDPMTQEIADLRAALAHDPSDAARAAEIARRYVALARREADPRYLGYAEAALRPWWHRPDAPSEILVLRATIHQSGHAFDAALADLSALLTRDPHDRQAWMTRAMILQARGDYAGARASCRHLSDVSAHRGTAHLLAVVCASSVTSFQGDAASAYDALARALAATRTASTEVRVWALEVLADIAVRTGRADAAERHFRSALALGEPSTFVLGAYADFLLDQKRPAEVVALLDGAARADALVLRLALAERALASSALGERVVSLRERFAAARARDDTTHRREEARFTLHLLARPREALDLAIANWDVQREPEDARILLEAADAADDPAAAAAVLAWLAGNRVEDVRLARLRERLADRP